jgi:hypothetical protein
MKTLYSLGLTLLLAFSVTGCELYFGEERNSDDDAYCAADGYYVRGEWVSEQCPGGGNACALDRDCAAGCYCDEAKGTCDEAGFCSQARDCPDGYVCDERSSCVPGGGSCAAAIDPSCASVAPRCPEGSVPLVAEGCYFDENSDGQFECQAISECAAPPSCERLQHATDCAAGDACTAVSIGRNCRRTDGVACQPGDMGCMCERFDFERCESM